VSIRASNLRVTDDQLESLVVAFPRLAVRKSPSQTLAPLVELKQLVSLATEHATVVEGRSLVRHTALLVQKLGLWVQGKAEDNELTASYVSGSPPNGVLGLTSFIHDRPS
jgi:hypothetical protein